MSSNYLIRGALASLPRGSTPERRWRLLFALMTVTPDEDGWRSIGMRLLGEVACLSQPHLREARDELARDKALEFNCDGAGNGARHYRWRILVEELNPSGSTQGAAGRPGVEPKRPGVEPPNALTSDDAPLSFRSFRASSSARVADIVRAVYPDATDDEIEGIEQAVRAKHAPDNARRYIARMAENGDLPRLPCGPERTEWPGPRSEACKRREPAKCAVGWKCHCRCHVKPLRAAS